MGLALRWLWLVAALAGAPSLAPAGEPATAPAGDWLYVAEGNRLRRLALAESGPAAGRHEIVIERASLDPAGRDVNGMICALPDGSGRFVAGEDTGQPERPAGWGVFAADGAQVGRLVPGSTARVPEPYGCAFDAQGRLFTTEIGDPGFARGAAGQLLLWFPPFDRFPEPAVADARSANVCAIATDLGTPSGVAVDREGRVYVASASGFRIHRFLPPFPASLDECTGRDDTGAPLAPDVRRETFAWARPLAGLLTYSGLAFAPHGNLYAASVATGAIGEFTPDGEFVRLVLDPGRWLPGAPTGSPQGLAVDAAGTLYYADLALVWRGGTLRPGPDGKVWRIRFDAAGAPQPPERVLGGLEYPDGVAVLPAAPEPQAPPGGRTSVQ
jgi:sugar lactone lactonase YvrE